MKLKYKSTITTLISLNTLPAMVSNVNTDKVSKVRCLRIELNVDVDRLL